MKVARLYTMNRAEALTLLRSRVRANITRCHAINAKRCLNCGECATIKEKLHQNHAFCDTQCQKKLHIIDSFLALGMKRGIDAVKEDVPDFELIEVTDDVLGDILDRAYERRLMSVTELEELLAMRRVNLQFGRVIARRTIPTIRFVCGEILRYVTDDFLVHFSGLEIMAKEEQNYSAEDSVAHWVSIQTVSTFSHLKELSLTQCKKQKLLNFAGMPRLEILRLFHMKKVTDQQLSPLTALHKLHIDSCSHITVECLRPMKQLRCLTLTGLVDTFEDLNFCQQLTELHMDTGVYIDDSGFAELVNLESLSLVRGPRTVTNRCLLNFPRLKRLNLQDNPSIVNLIVVDEIEEYGIVAQRETRIRLDELELLNISGEDCEFDIATTSQFPNLTSLDISGREGFEFHDDPANVWKGLKALYMLGWDSDWVEAFAQKPSALETFAVGRYRYAGLALWHHLKSLKCLHLWHYAEFDDEHLLALPQLEVLSVAHATKITNTGLSKMSNLRELTLIDLMDTKLTYNAVRDLNLQYFHAEKTRIRAKALDEMKARGVVVSDADSIRYVDPMPPHYYNYERRDDFL